MGSQHLFEDKFGEVIDRVDHGFLEIRWFDTTADMSTEDFKRWLSKFVELVDESSSKRVLVDATSFRMVGMGETMGWRDEMIIPRYNNAGITRFAFHMPAGAPPIGGTPAPEGPANFPTGYFATREEATEWLAT